MPPVKAPRRFEIIIRGDTEELRFLRPDLWPNQILYHLHRLLTGQPTALVELAHYGINVEVGEDMDQGPEPSDPPSTTA